MSELREILRSCPIHVPFVEKLIKDIKQWAISRKPKKVTAEERECTGGEAKHYNQALADYVKNIEEGK